MFSINFMSYQILSDAQLGLIKSILQPHYYCPLLMIGYLTSITVLLLTAYLLILKCKHF